MNHSENTIMEGIETEFRGVTDFIFTVLRWYFVNSYWIDSFYFFGNVFIGLK